MAQDMWVHIYALRYGPAGTPAARPTSATGASRVSHPAVGSLEPSHSPGARDANGITWRLRLLLFSVRAACPWPLTMPSSPCDSYYQLGGGFPGVTGNHNLGHDGAAQEMTKNDDMVYRPIDCIRCTRCLTVATIRHHSPLRAEKLHRFTFYPRNPSKSQLTISFANLTASLFASSSE